MSRDTQKRYKVFKFCVIYIDPNTQTETLIKGHLLRADQKKNLIGCFIKLYFGRLKGAIAKES